TGRHQKSRKLPYHVPTALITLSGIQREALGRDNALNLKLCPTQITHCPAGIPNLRRMPDFIAVEFHDIDVIRAGALAGRWAGAALSGVGCGKDAVCAHTFALLVRCERL